MSWFDNLGKMAKSAWDFTGIPGLVHDVANAGSNDDPWYVDAVNITKDVAKIGTIPLRGAVKGLFAVGEASYEVGQQWRTGIAGAQLKLPFMYNRFKNPGESYDDYVRRVDAEKDQITLGQATLSLLSPGKNAGDQSPWFRDWTEKHAQFLTAGFDIFDENDRKAAFEEQNIGKFITGTTDLTSSLFIDPLFVAGVAGKGLSIAARAPMYASLPGAGATGIGKIPGSLTRAVFGRMAMTTESMDDLLERALVGEGRAVDDIKFLAETDAKSQYGFWEAKRVTHPDAMAFLFGRAQTEQEVVATFRAVIGKDTKAMAEIAQKDPEAALLLDNMGELPKPYRDAMTGQLDGDLITNDAYNNAVDTFVSRLAREDDRYRIALEQVATGGNEFKGGTFARGPLAGTARRKAEKYAKTYADPDTTIIQATGFHPTVAIVNHARPVKDFFGKFRPSGVYNVNDGNSFREFNAFLDEAVTLSNGTFRGTAASFADKYLNAATEGERLNIIAQAEREAISVIAPNMSQKEIDYIYTMADYRRAKAIQEVRNRGFLSIFTENGPVIAKAPVLERESANVVVSMDLRKLKNGIERYENVLPGILSGIDPTDIATRSQKFLDTLDNVNDIFKTAVLLRLGYTVRNLAEAQLSLLAKSFALPAAVASGGTAAVNRFLNNRKADFSRAIDHVQILAGRADDPMVLRREVAYLTDQLRAIGMSREQLAKEVRDRIAEVERGGEATVRRYMAEQAEVGNIVGYEEAAAIALPQEIRRLREVLEELESVTLYHGTADDAFAFDPARPISASASPGIASRYTKPEFSFGLERYLNLETGRPVPLRNVTRRGPERPKGAPIGSPEVAARMPEYEFDALNNYVNSDGWRVGVQQKLRAGEQPPRGPVAGVAYEWDPITVERAEVALKDLNAAVSRSVIDEPMVVWRGVGRDSAGYAKANVGDVIKDDGFISTSKSRTVADRYFAQLRESDVSVGGFEKTILKIELPRGQRGIDVNATFSSFGRRNNHEPEKEVLLPSGTEFKIVGKKTVEDLHGDDVIEITVRPVQPKAKPYPERLIDAAEAMKADMIDAVRAGNEVRINRGGKTFRSVTEDEIRTMDPRTLERAVFRVGQPGGSVVPVKAYGSALDLRKWSDIPLDVRNTVFGGNIKNWREWTANKNWQDQTHPIYAYLREKGYGRFHVADDARAGKTSTMILPEAVGKSGLFNSVSARTRQMETEGAVAAVDDLALDQKFATPKERRAARVAARRAEKSRRTTPAVSPYYERESLIAMINNGVEDAAVRLGEDFAAKHALLDDMMSRLSARVGAAETNRVRQRLGYGYFQYDAMGHSYEVPEAFQNASWFWSRTSAEPTWNSFVGSQQMAFMTGIGSRAMRPVKPNDPRYFEAWAGVLNMHFRDPESGVMDPVVRMILDGNTDDEIVRWLTKTRAGRVYSNNTYTTPGRAVGFTKMKAGELDDFIGEKVATTRQAVKTYVPDEDTALLLSATDEAGAPVSGAAIEEFLMNRFGVNPENLPEINGLLVTTSKEYRDQERIVDTVNRRVMRFLGSLPEDTFARHPLVSAVYKDNVKKNIAGIAAAKGGERLTVEELNRAERAAREEARREVERTLFTIVRRTGASSSQVMRLLFPFYAAFENTVYRWTGIIGDNPAVLTAAARNVAMLVNGMNVVDRDGNPVEDASKLTGEESLVVQVPQAFIKSLPGAWQEVMENAFKNINIPLSSLDVVTQGQPGNPGFGPYAVLPAYLVLRERPEFEVAFKPLFPAGMPTNASDIFLPSALRRLKTMWTQDAQYVRTFNQMLRYETYNYNTGKRTEAPTVDEIKDKTNKFFILRTLTALSAPFAISPEVDFYQQQYRQLQEQYADYRDPQTGERVPGMADTKFLEMYPDFFEATISLSKNIGGLEASQETVKNLRKFSGLMAAAEAAGDPELMGWLANDFDGKYDFSQAAYQWQYRKGAYPGSASTYRQNRNPQELVRDANLKRGWTEFRKIQDIIDTYKIQNGITSNRDPLMDQFNQAKRAWLDYMMESNPDWYAAYMSPDRGKYMRRAGVLEQAFADKKWLAQNGDRPVVKAVAMYLDVRKQLGSTLLQRDRAGGSRSLEAESNQDLADAWDGFVTQLKTESPEFADFHSRYFPNDPVVL